jgi:hypothetical protein
MKRIEQNGASQTFSTATTNPSSAVAICGLLSLMKMCSRYPISRVQKPEDMPGLASLGEVFNIVTFFDIRTLPHQLSLRSVTIPLHPHFCH